MNVMTKEEAKREIKIRERTIEIKLGVIADHNDSIEMEKEEIAKLEAIINKPDRWQDGLVQPEKEEYFYLSSSSDKGLTVNCGSEYDREPEYAFKTKEQAELIKEKMILMQGMHAFAHVKNEGWVPDWKSDWESKYGIVSGGDGIMVDWCAHANSFVFGVAVKSMEIAGEMIDIFDERIEKFYNKMY